MIKILQHSNILEAPNGIICHGVNCMGVMGAGLAKQIKYMWPNVFAEYKKYCDTIKNKKELLGQSQVIQVEDGLWVANLFTQFMYGTNRRQLDMEALYRSIESLLNKVQNNDQYFHFPKIGCGLAGGNWEEVKPIIVKLFEHANKNGNNYTVYLYE